MINTSRLLKVSAVWISVVYVICFLGVALFESSRAWFMLYALHTTVSLEQSVVTIGTFFSGLIIWNIVAFLGIGLFALIFNKVKE
jgi:uncharacterized membrane protein